MKDDIPFLWHDVSCLRGIREVTGGGGGWDSEGDLFEEDLKEDSPTFTESMPQD